jgi:hypothetical protein
MQEFGLVDLVLRAVRTVTSINLQISAFETCLAAMLATVTTATQHALQILAPVAPCYNSLAPRTMNNRGCYYCENGPVTNRHPQLAATTIIQRRSSNEPARSLVHRQDRPDSSPVDPKENVSKQGKVSRHPQTVWPIPCINPAHLPIPDS